MCWNPETKRTYHFIFSASKYEFDYINASTNLRFVENVENAGKFNLQDNEIDVF